MFTVIEMAERAYEAERRYYLRFDEDRPDWDRLSPDQKNRIAQLVEIHLARTSPKPVTAIAVFTGAIDRMKAQSIAA